MALVITPTWDPTNTVSLSIDAARRELVCGHQGTITAYRLEARKTATAGWVEHRLDHRGAKAKRVSVSDVVIACMRELEAESAVLAITATAIDELAARKGRWRDAARRLRGQRDAARREQRRVSVVPFQVLFEHQEALEPAGAASRAADRIGYLAAQRPDTSRLKRRMGLAQQQDRNGRPAARQRTVNYPTGVLLCQALDIDPAELGL